MNILVQALRHDLFAEAICADPPTMAGFFDRALTGEFPNFGEEQRDFLRMSEGAATVRDSEIAAQARFVVHPLEEWEDRPPEAEVTDERFDGQWMHAQKTSTGVILVPDDGDLSRFNLALYVPQPIPDDGVTALVPVRYRPDMLAMAAVESPCQEGYKKKGKRRQGTCVRNGCQGRCRLRMRLEKRTAITYHCPCS